MSKIVWAIDAFHLKPKVQLRTLRAVEAFFAGSAREVLPASALAFGKLDAETHLFLNQWHDLASAADRNISRLLKGVKSPGLAHHRLLRQDRTSLTQSVRSLVHFAIDSKADVIAASTCARSGVAKMILGSFAESLLHQSPLPVLLVNPKNSSVKKIKTLVFATDLSEASHKAYQKVLEISKTLGLEIVLFHKIEFPFFAEGLPVLVAFESTEEFQKSIEETTRKWADLGKKRGVPVRVHIERKEGKTVTQINALIRKLGKSTALALASQSGPIQAALLGSLTRKLVSESTCPILVLRSNQELSLQNFIENVKQWGYTYSAQPLVR